MGRKTVLLLLHALGGAQGFLGARTPPSCSKPATATYAASVSTPLNIVTAIDVYAKVPPTKFDVRSLEPGSAVERWASERPPGGDDPFKLVARELAPFSDNIKVRHVRVSPVCQTSKSNNALCRDSRRLNPPGAGGSRSSRALERRKAFLRTKARKALPTNHCDAHGYVTIPNRGTESASEQ